MNQKIIYSILLVLQLTGAVLCGKACGKEFGRKHYDLAVAYLVLVQIFLICFAITMFAGLFV